MTVNQLKEIMKFHLANFNDEREKVSDETIHNKILSDKDGYGNASSQYIYKAVIRWTLRKEKHADVAWPVGWMKKSVKQLAPMLL
jgi:hypothetical protein